MPLRLIELNAHPGRIAATKIADVVEDGAFFLDFSRQLERLHWFGATNRWVGPIISVFAPVVHERESKGGFVIGVHRSDPYFKQILALWSKRYPEREALQTMPIDGLQVIADFGAQFPEDSQ